MRDWSDEKPLVRMVHVVHVVHVYQLHHVHRAFPGPTHPHRHPKLDRAAVEASYSSVSRRALARRWARKASCSLSFSSGSRSDQAVNFSTCFNR